MALSFESVDEILMCDHSNENDRAVLFCGAADLCNQMNSGKCLIVRRFSFLLLKVANKPFVV